MMLVRQALHEEAEHLALPGRERAHAVWFGAGPQHGGGGARIEWGFTAGGGADGVGHLVGVDVLEQVAAGAGLERAEDARPGPRRR